MPAQVTNIRVLLLGTEPSATDIPVGVTTGVSIPVSMALHGIVAFYFTSIGTTSGGTILIEESDFTEKTQTYGGTWSQVASILASSFTGGAQIAYHISDCAYGYLRVRISSAITGGGSITAVMRSRGAA